MEHVLITLWTVDPNYPFCYAIEHKARNHFDLILFGAKPKYLKELKLPDSSIRKLTYRYIGLIRTLLIFLFTGRIQIRIINKEA